MKRIPARRGRALVLAVLGGAAVTLALTAGPALAYVPNPGGGTGGGGGVIAGYHAPGTGAVYSPADVPGIKFAPPPGKIVETGYVCNLGDTSFRPGQYLYIVDSESNIIGYLTCQSNGNWALSGP